MSDERERFVEEKERVIDSAEEDRAEDDDDFEGHAMEVGQLAEDQSEPGRSAELSRPEDV